VKQRIIIFALALLSAGVIHAEPAPLVETHQTPDFSIKLPAGWTPVPKAEISRVAGAKAKIEPRPPTSELTCAFLDTNSVSRFAPRILVYTQLDSSVGEAQFRFVHRYRKVKEKVFENLSFGFESIFHRSGISTRIPNRFIFALTVRMER
jgi:hypothetical protein